MEVKSKSLIENKKGDVAVRIDALIEARYKLSSKENDIIDMLSMQLKDDNNLRYEIDLNNYMDYYITNKEVARVNKKRTFNMAVNMIKGKGIHIKTSNHEIYYPWFTKIEYIEGTGNILIDLHPEIKDVMMSSQRGIYYDIKYTVNLTNEYAKRYYYCCKLYSMSIDNRKGFRIDRLNDLQHKLEVPKSYIERFSYFEEKVLIIAQQQINEYSDLKIVYEKVKKGRETTHIKTFIEKKTKEELHQVDCKILNVKFNKNEQLNKNISIRRQIEEEIKPYLEIIKIGINNKFKGIEGEQTLKLKKELAEKYDMTIRNIDRYIYININLIDKLIELYDKKFITLAESEKLSRKSANIQIKEYKTIENNIKKYKQYLCTELADLLDSYKITYNSAEKYSKETMKKQLEYYNKITKKNKHIDIDYKEVDNKISVDLLKNKDMENLLKENRDIKEIEQYLKNLKEVKITGITEKILKEIYYNSGKNVEKVKYISTKLSEQNVDIPKPLNWISAVVKPGVYQEPIKAKCKIDKFNNYNQRKYDYNVLERKLLGWDKED